MIACMSVCRVMPYPGRLMYMHAVCMHIYLVTSERLPEGMAVSKEILSVACNCSGSESLENLVLCWEVLRSVSVNVPVYMRLAYEI